MKRFLILLLLFPVLSCSRPAGYIQVSGQAQGGAYSVKLNMEGVRESPEAIRDSIQALLVHIDTTLSGYNKRSQLSRFNAGEAICPNALFLEMYGFSYRMWQRSQGAVDCAAGPLFDAWGFGFREGTMPSDEEVSRLRQQCGMDRLPEQLPLEDGVLDPARLGFPRLNYNAVAQGYSCDIIARYLYSLGVKDMLVDIGEIWCDGVSPSGKPWSVGVDRPTDEGGADEVTHGRSVPEELDGIWTSDGKPAGIVTSGNNRKFYIRDGRKYAHTINPRTGYPVQHNLLSATVVSTNNAAESDAIATWCMVVGLQASQVLILGDPALEGYLVYTDNDGLMQEWASPGFTLITD